MAHDEDAYPLDLGAVGYPYLERPNRTLGTLFARQVLAARPAPRVLDVGCGAGANARAFRAQAPRSYLVGVEPDASAADLARGVCDEVFAGSAEAWVAETAATAAPFDAVVLSDVLEHLADPVALLRELTRHAALREATFLVSVPNYAVWYNRLRTLRGRFDYALSGLYDRTHLRFFTARSLRRMLEHVGLAVVGQGSTPSLVQSSAPWLRRAFTADLARGAHLALDDSALYRVYARYLEPGEAALCDLWPTLLGFQLVVAARARE